MSDELSPGQVRAKKRARETQSDIQSWNLAELSAAMCEERSIQPLRSFEQLARIYQQGIDYSIDSREGKVKILCAAWHGGVIERGADLLADAIAGDSLSFYAFQAHHDASPPHPLRITSIRFDEPQLLTLAKKSELVLGVHCCDTAPGIHRVFIGGGAQSDVRASLIDTLRAHDFNAGPDQLFPGHHPSNPCNRGRSPGLQLEVSQTYMDWLLAHPDHFFRLAETVSAFLLSLPIGCGIREPRRQKR